MAPFCWRITRLRKALAEWMPVVMPSGICNALPVVVPGAKVAVMDTLPSELLDDEK